MKLKLKLASDAKNIKKGSYRCVNQKRKDKEEIPPLINKAGKLVMTDEDKAEIVGGEQVLKLEKHCHSLSVLSLAMTLVIDLGTSAEEAEDKLANETRIASLDRREGPFALRNKALA
ncbi:hypothetical protein DUI87_28129 [Hirundo rustica rustica]|uniref:Uncharacterized protein n=1 Tax=Hirundo rustica rustica TaxID=333673 RepID=A0A3M0J3B1_HIRRU|nr:hypothetical protein DUI87_28129 [Hirundo rustica rustica]